MTEDRAVLDSPVMAPNGAMTDISSKGLLPQLIDVLQALAQGQELLSHRIREAMLEQARNSLPVVCRSAQTGPSSIGVPRSFVRADPNASIGIHREFLMDIGELGVNPTSGNGNGNGNAPEPITGLSAAYVGLNVSDAVALSNPSAATVTYDVPVDHSNETSARTDVLNSARAGETTMEPLNRDYNFFDELDARLAELQDPADRSEDS